MLTDIILAATNSLKVAGQIAIGLMNLKSTTEVQAKAIELNQQILAAQHELFAANASQSALVERIRELERQVMQMKDWEAQKQRYQLKAPFARSLVYALQKAMSNGEPPHYLCTRCYEDGKRSILQNALSSQWTVFACSICKTQVHTGWLGQIPAKYAEEIQQN